ncbi:DUF3618 domain-containing protein [Streptomyces chartreusis]|uniref:DUF3618 domain-containing protein n=1 Tax=Streptomyces chartreusis TaxID=1969 RepID=UPI0036268970
MTQPEDDPTTANPEELREQVEQTRAELGETVQALTAKADLKNRAQGKATAAREQATVKAGELKARAADLTHQARDKMPAPVRDRANQAAEQARLKKAQAGQLWQDRAPEPVRQKTAQGARTARENRTLLLATTGAAALMWLAWRRRKR